MKQPVNFNSNGVTLAGLLERPAGEVKAYALFAHCFTCGKDIAAASRISRALTQQGYGVLRFDFTGLGNSDGDFANANFSSNLADLKAAAGFLRDNYSAPNLLIGHSLGGAAILSVAGDIPEATAVVSIAAPARAEHVIHNFEEHLDEIKEQGTAKVKLGFRQFNIQRQFIDDVAEHSREMFDLGKKALLVMHSPMDDTVAIGQAEQIYNNAKHPKSFISLDKADHLLSNKADAEYVASAIYGWAEKYIDSQTPTEKSTAPAKGTVVVEEKDHKFSQTVTSDSHHWIADEPIAVGGQNLGPDPYEHLLAALGTCTSMTLRMYATHKDLPVENIKVTLSHQKNYLDDCQNCDNDGGYAELISRTIEISGDLSDAQRQRMLEIADKCPVHKTLHSHIVVDTQLAD